MYDNRNNCDMGIGLGKLPLIFFNILNNWPTLNHIFVVEMYFVSTSFTCNVQPLQCGHRLYTSESGVNIRQILTSIYAIWRLLTPDSDV